MNRKVIGRDPGTCVETSAECSVNCAARPLAGCVSDKDVDTEVSIAVSSRSLSGSGGSIVEPTL